MLSIFFLIILISASEFERIPYLNSSDLFNDDKIFIYIYYQNPYYECKACTYFNNRISEISSIKVKRVNFYSDPYLASHFYQFIFPSFVVRYKGKSYVIDVETVDELFKYIDTGEWKDIKPIKWYLDTNSFITKGFAFFSYLFFNLIEYFSVIIENTPVPVFTALVTFIIAYLIISIINVFKNDTEKVKKD